MSAGLIKAGRAAVEIIAQNKTEPGVKSALGSLKGMAMGLSSAAAMVSSTIAAISSSAIVGAVSAAVKNFADLGSEINDAAARTGLATDELQFLRFAANQSGASLADVELALKHMAKHGRDVNTFARIGQEIAAIGNKSERSAQAQEVFGRSGTKLLGMFAELNQLRAASKNLGPILTPEEVKLSDALQDSMDALVVSVKRASDQAGAALAPALQDSLEIAIGITAEIGKWIKSLKMVPELIRLGLPQLPFGKFLGKSLSRFEKRGEQALAPPIASPFDEDEEAADKARENTEKMLKSIETASAKRAALIREFETPAEQFLRKQQEIIQAMNQLNRNRVLGFVISEEATGQQGGLATALSRLRAQEQQRISNEMKRAQEETPKQAQAEVSRGSRGTFSATGAGLLGIGTRLIVHDPEGKVHTKELVGIRKVLDERLFVPVFR